MDMPKPEDLVKYAQEPLNVDWDLMNESISSTIRTAHSSKMAAQLAKDMNINRAEALKSCSRGAEIAQAMVQVLAIQDRLHPVSAGDLSMALHILQLKLAQVSPGIVMAGKILAGLKDLGDTMKIMFVMKIMTGCGIKTNSKEFMEGLQDSPE